MKERNLDTVDTYLWRENKLWEGMRLILPEHKEAIRQQQLKDTKVDLHGELSEEQLYELGEIAFDAYKHTYPVELVYWKDGFYHTLICLIARINLQTKTLLIEDESSVYSEWIPVRHIYKVSRTN